MIQCPRCEALYHLNTFYCDECGAFLGEDSRRTEIFPPSPVNASVEGYDELQTVERNTDASSRSAITLVIGQEGHRVSVSLNKEIILGRLDPVHNNYPDVDLFEYGGLAQGVSRRHARIACQQDEVVVEDLGSVNGSSVNGEQLRPYLSYALKNGDVLQLGKVGIKVVF
jgi:pSer/pThr/pTyr-binding forkhead associated (FHA) protein